MPRTRIAFRFLEPNTAPLPPRPAWRPACDTRGIANQTLARRADRPRPENPCRTARAGGAVCRCRSGPTVARLRFQPHLAVVDDQYRRLWSPALNDDRVATAFLGGQRPTAAHQRIVDAVASTGSSTRQRTSPMSSAGCPPEGCSANTIGAAGDERIRPTDRATCSNNQVPNPLPPINRRNTSAAQRHEGTCALREVHVQVTPVVPARCSPGDELPEACSITVWPHYPPASADMISSDGLVLQRFLRVANKTIDRPHSAI